MPVTRGDLFRRTGRNHFGHPYPTWQVVDVSRGIDGVWLAEIQLIQDPVNRKRISVEALRDRRLYETA